MRKLKKFKSFNESTSTGDWVVSTGKSWGELLKEVQDDSYNGEITDRGLDFMLPTTEAMKRLVGESKSVDGSKNYWWNFRIGENATFYFFNRPGLMYMFEKYFNYFNDGSYELKRLPREQFNDDYMVGIAITKK